MNRNIDNVKDGKIAVGLYDVPSSSQAKILYYNPLESNAIIFGLSMSGKTVMVKNILARMNELEPYCNIEHTYIIDFGGNLVNYADLGRVCACFDNSNGENVKRIFNAVENGLDANSRALRGTGKNFIDYNKEHPDAPLPHITLIIENVTALLTEERFESYQGKLTRIARDGLSKGVSVILTANGYIGQISRFSNYFSQKFVLEMPDDKYIEIFNTKSDKPMRMPGRGITNIDQKLFEFQSYLPFEDENKGLDDLKKKASSYAVPDEKKMKAFPAELTKDYIVKNYNIKEEDFFVKDDKAVKAVNDDKDVKVEDGQHSVILGLEYYDHSPIVLDFGEVYNIAIYGNKQSGKSNLLSLIIEGINKTYENAYFIFIDDKSKKLEKLCEQLPEGQQYDILYTVDDFFRWSKQTNNEFYIIRNKKMYEFNEKWKRTPAELLIKEAPAQQFHCIFCDVPKLVDPSFAKVFNSSINQAFLLNTISTFLRDKGSSSVFRAMDIDEVKAEYAACEIGDAFVYDIDREDLHKFKVIKKD